MKLLKKNFFKQDAVKVARELIGKKIEANNVSGFIVETEAYKDDLASHARKKTKRSTIMYETFGKVYVYLIYGMYYCLNFTTNGKKPGAVLVRAVEPEKGIQKMKKRRKTNNIKNLCSGPGKLCQAFGINKNFNGEEINKKIKLSKTAKEYKISKSGRIGINQGRDLEWRFFAKGNKFISK